MSTIVREHYPVSSLPEDLRAGFPQDGWVRISLEVSSYDDVENSDEDLTLEQIYALGATAPRRTADEIDADLRALRDDWQIRE